MTRWAALVLIGLTLAGCATGSPRANFDADVVALAPTLSGGMSQIRDKAIDAPDIDRLFLAALGHLSVIDSDVQIEAVGPEVVVSVGEMTVAKAARPRPQDLGSWVDISQGLITAARKVSKPLSTATSEQMLQAMFEGVMPLLDTYSRYAGRREARRNQIARNGFVGLGIDLEPMPQGALVRLTVKNGPADNAGLLPGDIILRADGMKLAGQPLPMILRRLDGPRDAPVRLNVRRVDSDMMITVRRGLIIPETVKGDVHDGVLELSVKSFNQRTASAIADKMATVGPVRGVILDLRGDPGGLLDQAVAVADLFLDKGVIATLRGRHPGAMQFYAATAGDVAQGAPIVMILDGRSASAAEILASALQENGRAIAIGTASVGKGTVQTIVPLANGGEIALTWARVFTPAGTLLAGRGVLPDVCTAGVDASAPELLAALAKAGPHPRPPAEIVRSTCRPTPHAGEVVDLEVARQLVNDAPLRAALHLPDGGQLATSP
jgi:carboxyl-terminal processing protease